jgi:ribosomal protein S18 acetylase RimI-like enzyme
MSVEIRPAGPEDLDAVVAFMERVPAGERAFFKEEADRASVRRSLSPDAIGRRAVAVRLNEVVGSVYVVPLRGWSDHVGEVRLVVDPDCRRQQLGRRLARQALMDAVELGLKKLSVEVVAEQEGAVRMFESLGFRAEGLLPDHVRDRDGGLHDLIVLGHLIEQEWAGMTSVGIADDLH